MGQVEKTWETNAGFNAVVIKQDAPFSHRCGYVGLPKDHQLYKVHYDRLDSISVHGGVTFSEGDGEYPIKGSEWWIGFDCNHLGDTENPKSLQYCIIECESLSEQLK